jgi:tetratricopeptide (TPR) repeat protein
MLSQSPIFTLLLLSVGLVSPSFAGMKKDIADCNASDRVRGAAACTRVMNSGRLPRRQFYISYFNRAGAYRKSGDNRRALADLDRVVQRRPRFAKAYYARALTQHDLGSLNDALADMDRYIVLKPKNGSAYYRRAVLRRENDDPDAALADLDKAASLKPDITEVKLMRALARSDKGEQAEAKAEIVVSFRQRQLDATGADLDKALQIRKNFAAAHALRGRVFEERGKIARAERSFQQALASPADFFDGRPAHAIARQKLGKEKGAGVDKRVLQSDPVQLGCRRFVSAVGMTLPFDCTE